MGWKKRVLIWEAMQLFLCSIPWKRGFRGEGNSRTDLSSKLRVSLPQKMRRQKLVANTSCGRKSPQRWHLPSWTLANPSQHPKLCPKSRWWGTGLLLAPFPTSRGKAALNVRREAEPPCSGLRADQASVLWISPHDLVAKQVSQISTLWNSTWPMILLVQQMECLL